MGLPRRLTRFAALALATSPPIACGGGSGASGAPTTLPPIPQLLVWVDTDMSVPTYLDTLRIEQLDDDGNVIATREQTLPDPSDWPASLGVTGSGVAHLRARAYAGQYAIDDQPPASVTIDRLIDVSPPATGVANVLALLSGDCWGSAANLDAGRTCVPQPGADPDVFGYSDQGLEPLDAPPASTAAGTWAGALTTPCAGSPRADSGVRDDEVCIPGGASFLGFDPQPLTGGEDAMVSYAKLLRLSPFFLDAHEVTLARYNAGIARGFVPPGSPTPTACAPPAGTSDLAPVTCVTWDQAHAFCAFDGGRTLPSEAQWHHAASGRGQERSYPWGWAPPTCDDAVWGEYYGGDPSPLSRCEVDGGIPGYPSPVGSRGVDTTIDGASDMAGNVREFALDYYEPFDRGCWSFVPLARDFVCSTLDPAWGGHAVRGGAWDVVPDELATTFRTNALSTTDQGFRCARAASP